MRRWLTKTEARGRDLNRVFGTGAGGGVHGEHHNLEGHHAISASRHANRLWMTPTARDHKDGATTLANTPVNGLLGRQVLVMKVAGSDTSDVRRTLNPLFVEALMGWPTGWTGFAFAATAWSLWLPRMRSELSQLNCWRMDDRVPA